MIMNMNIFCLLFYYEDIKHKEYKFSWDSLDWSLEDKFKWLYKKLKRCTVFFICGFHSNFEEDLRKANIIKKIGHNGYAMRYETVYNDKKYIQFARWINQHHVFQAMGFTEFLASQ